MYADRQRRWTKRIAMAISVSALLTTFGVGPAAARPIEDYGATFNCRYRTIQGTFPAMGDLRRIVVTPPIMFGDENEQTVGWRAIVRRDRIDYETGASKITTWRSRIRMAVAYQGQQAEFTPIVYFPAELSSTSIWDGSWFEGSIRLIWYGQDGSVQRTVLHKFWSAYTYVDGELWTQLWDATCEEPRQLEFIN